ncbi:small nuclear ribonucleoprotein polypeptide B [Tritrichomonas foetus]|uniref:Small nuclear ribonucleoprotein polypeptide B n=1 Tax=Tritrichomonas foetus TaxID=1144522 RepID=A0A1J4JCL1_9EUKA|nr:small nuclear ribonucleoprotein polypeptide B [Tritrichomonas foetus]|eukprot:OHS96409.1 small nuclear ribonucleoprotein polypeptide B [Tritrichomonas foetus]
MTLPIAPNQTLYIKNLDDKISVSELKRQLYCLFSFVGPVVDIEARKGAKTRGQAWVSFISVDAASIAMQRLQGFNLLGKEMNISYAKDKSKSLNDYMEFMKRNVAQEEESETEEPIIRETPILKVEGYPPRTKDTILAVLFRQIKGLQKVEIKEGNYALVHYESATSATEALNHFQNFRVSGEYRLSVQYWNAEEQA